MTRKRKEKIKIDFVCEKCEKNKNRIKINQQSNGRFLIAMKDVNVVENL